MTSSLPFGVFTIALLGLGCGDKPDLGDTADSGADTADSGADTAVVEYNGTSPKQPIAAPVFSATNRDGSARDQSALIGQPTVMWFYPAAGTYG